ncbi:hypothetical protein [Azospirillum argentinense]
MRRIGVRRIGANPSGSRRGTPSGPATPPDRAARSAVRACKDFRQRP